MNGPWIVSVRDVGPTFTFAHESRARQRARELVEAPGAEVLVYTTDSEQNPVADPAAYPNVQPFPDAYPDPDPYGERWVYRHGVDPVREVLRSGAWRTVELEPRFSDAAVRADNDHLQVPVNVRFEGWAYAWRGTCLTCGGECYRRAESPEHQVWRHGFPTD